MKIVLASLAATALARPVPHTPAWFDLTVRDVGAAEDFYSSVLGWRFGDTQGPYTVIEDEGAPIGGLFLQKAPVGDGGVSVYFRVGDLGSALSRAEERGATVLFGPTAFPGGDVMALFQDPDGNHVGLMQLSAGCIIDSRRCAPPAPGRALP